MIDTVCQIIRIIICVMMISATVSCIKNIKHQEPVIKTIEAKDVNSDQTIGGAKNTTIDNRGGLIKDNGLRIRSNPGTDAEILGILNIDEYVSILAVTEEKQIIDNSLDYWYKIKTSENIIGWIFGKYVYLLEPGEPFEFANDKWRRSFGELFPKENISLADLQSCSWHSGTTYLIFSKEENYVIGEHWTGPHYGVYELLDKVVLFNPPFTYFIASEKYQIDKLYYSDEVYYDGTPVLKNVDENLVFYPNNTLSPELGEIVKINRHYCEKIWEKTKLNANNILYTLPDRLSANVFDNDSYYGDKATESNTVKLAKTTIDSIVWYYINLDFTTEPIDGGGPYFQGWLPEEYLE
jgi:hypothetical protein